MSHVLLVKTLSNQMGAFFTLKDKLEYTEDCYYHNASLAGALA